MTLYRLEITLTSPLGTPLVGPTLFGLVCQVIYEKEGVSTLEDWLSKPEQLWKISDGFPTGCLPKPLTKPFPLRPEKLDTLKARKKRPWIRRNAWMRHRTSWSEVVLHDNDFLEDQSSILRRAHNVVHRHGRGTLDTGGLFFTDDDWRFTGNSRDVDLYVESDDSPEWIFELIKAVGERGYGRDASTGCGQFVVRKPCPDPDLAELTDARRRMSLSRGVLTPSSMQDALWRVVPHLGRVGPELTLAGVPPFKRPVILTRPGCTYQPAGSSTAGKWVDNIHAERPEIGLNGFHLSIPFSEAAH